MKYSIYLFLLLLLVNCKPDKDQSVSKEEAVSEKGGEFDWLIGNWTRTGEKEGNQTFEYWQTNDKGELIGMGCTLKDQDTIWRENVLLAQDDKGWNFSVVGMGENTPTVFKITAVHKNGFVCENELNEFPKKIEYAFDGKNINAVISGGGPTIPFNFIPMKQ